MEFHINELKKVCRVCGKRAQKAKGKERLYLVHQHRDALATVFSIDVSGDTEDTHPLQFCYSCHTQMRNWKKRSGTAPPVDRVYTWDRHSETDCMVGRRAYLVT